MLERIFQENWSELETLTGDASNIPHAILELLTEDDKEFERAYWKIENHVVVQSDLFEAATLVPKYLEEVFLKAKFKHGVQELLFQIGNGTCKDKKIEDRCYFEVIGVIKTLIQHPAIEDTEYKNLLQDDLKDLYELRNDRENT